VYNLFEMSPKNFSMADKVVYEKRWDIYDEKKMISDANKSLSFLNFGNNTKNPQNATRLLER